MATKRIYITESDRARLADLLERTRDPELKPYLDALQSELARAKVVPSREIPGDVVTMNSTISLTDMDSGEAEEFTLVFPQDADAEIGRISVIAPLGTAMLGHRVGNVFEWQVPMGRTRWRVEKVLYQPEAAGDFDR